MELLDPVQVQLQRAKHTPIGFFEAVHKQARCSDSTEENEPAPATQIDVRVAASADAFPRASDLVKAAVDYLAPWTKKTTTPSPTGYGKAP